MFIYLLCIFYEGGFFQIRTCMSWTGGTQRSLVMIGDACPHEPGDAANETGLDWRDELKLLTNQWVRSGY